MTQLHAPEIVSAGLLSTELRSSAAANMMEDASAEVSVAYYMNNAILVTSRGASICGDQQQRSQLSGERSEGTDAMHLGREKRLSVAVLWLQ